MRTLQSPKFGMDLIVGQAVALDVGINRIPMLLVVAQGIEYLCQRDVRQANHNLFGGEAELPQFGDGAHRRAGTCDDGCALEDLIGADNVRMLGGGRHQGLAPACEVVSQPIEAPPRCQLLFRIQAQVSRLPVRAGKTLICWGSFSIKGPVEATS